MRRIRPHRNGAARNGTAIAYRQGMYKLFSILAILAAACTRHAVDPAADGWDLDIFVISDAGRNGSYDQRKIGELMGEYADLLGPEIVVSCGDLFHYQGVQSVSDPLFISNFESVYPHGELQCPWYGVLGNHEYRGDTQAVIDYTQVSRRWNMPSRYYSIVLPVNDDDPHTDSVRLTFIDTTPLISKYRASPEYADAHEIEADSVQLRWLDSTLNAATEKWQVVIGHHPVYSYDKKADSESIELREKLEPIFRRYGIDTYLSGHIHTFQHLRNGDGIDYAVNASASLGRKPIEGEMTVYSSPSTGFALLQFDSDRMRYSLVDSDGRIEYFFEREK